MLYFASLYYIHIYLLYSFVFLVRFGSVGVSICFGFLILFWFGSGFGSGRFVYELVIFLLLFSLGDS